MAKQAAKKRTGSHAGGLGGKLGKAIVAEFLQGPGTVKEIAERAGCCGGRVGEVVRASEGAIARRDDGTYGVKNAAARKALARKAAL
jgi:hypothetical protein